MLEVEEILKGKFSISILCSLIGLDSKWDCTYVYGSCNVSEKIQFLSKIEGKNRYWNAPWIVFGDFNSIQQTAERPCSQVSRSELCSFNNSIDNCGLLEFDKSGPKFSYSNN